MPRPPAYSETAGSAILASTVQITEPQGKLIRIHRLLEYRLVAPTTSMFKPCLPLVP